MCRTLPDSFPSLAQQFARLTHKPTDRQTDSACSSKRVCCPLTQGHPPHTKAQKCKAAFLEGCLLRLSATSNGLQLWTAVSGGGKQRRGLAFGNTKKRLGNLSASETFDKRALWVAQVNVHQVVRWRTVRYEKIKNKDQQPVHPLLPPADHHRGTERPICRRVSTCSTLRVSVLRSRNLFQTTCQKKTARKHLHVYLCSSRIRASILMNAGGSAWGAGFGPEPAIKCITLPQTLAPCLFSRFHLDPETRWQLQEPPEWRSTSRHMGRRWNGRGKLLSEIFHSARQFVVMDIFLTRGRFQGPVFSKRGSRRWKKTATRHVESDAKGSKS